MMVIVPIVVAKHSTIIRSTNSRIDVSQNVLHDLAVIRLPNFFLEYCALSFPFQPVRRINSLGDLQLFRLLSHYSNIAQAGARSPHLLRKWLPPSVGTGQRAYPGSDRV